MTEGRLADAVKPDVSDARLARQWDAIQRRVSLPKRFSRARPWIWTTIGTVATAGAVLGIYGWVQSEAATHSAWDGAIVESQTEPVTLRLKDGSRIDLQQSSRLEVVERRPRAVQLQLRKGSASFDVAKDPQRTFAVLAEGVTVRVIGTRFSLAIDTVAEGRRVDVSVERGTVEAHAEGTQVVLQSGQRWSKWISNTELPSTAIGAPAPAQSSAEPVEDPVPPVSRGNQPAAEGVTPRGARELFEEANSARRAGDLASAAEHYRSLLREFPSDARSGLAAFELGRLLQDRFGDAPGAARALQRSIGSSASAGFREDAMARLVRAYATMGAARQCEQARSAYLQSYPSGVHATAVRRACGER